MKKIICILTATRAEYGLLKPIISKLSEVSEFDVRIVVTGMHLSSEFGLTYKEIENDGYVIDKKIDILLNASTSSAVTKTMGLALLGFADYFQELNPDMLIVLGDRYETFAVCCAAMNEKIPIAHLHGGETTEGSLDEAYRHSITKMSYLHFTCTDAYRNRVIQLGEDPNRVFNVGAIGQEIIRDLKYLSKEELEESIKFKINNKVALMTFHPVTLENSTEEEQLINIFQALDEFDNVQVIITKANADAGGSRINKLIDGYINKNHEKYIAFESLGQLRYLSAMKYCDFVIGNSSSGIIEAPSFKKPTINIGNRQKGRIQANSVINCNPHKDDVVHSINIALSGDFIRGLEHMNNPYGSGNTSTETVRIIKEYFLREPNSIIKNFYDIL